MIVFINSPGHMTNMAAMPIYDKNFKNFLLGKVLTEPFVLLLYHTFYNTILAIKHIITGSKIAIRLILL